MRGGDREPAAARSSRCPPASAFSSRSSSSPGGAAGDAPRDRAARPCPPARRQCSAYCRPSRVRVKYSHASLRTGADTSVSCDAAVDLVEDPGLQRPRCAPARRSVNAFSASRYASTSGSSRSRSQYQSSTRSSSAVAQRRRAPGRERRCGRSVRSVMNGGVSRAPAAESAETPEAPTGRPATLDRAMTTPTIAPPRPRSRRPPRSSRASPGTPTVSCPRSSRSRAPGRC